MPREKNGRQDHVEKDSTCAADEISHGALPSKDLHDFEFISGLDRSYATRTRKFVIRRHFAKKRDKQKAQQKTQQKKALVGTLDIGTLDSAQLQPSSAGNRSEIYRLLDESPKDPFDSLSLRLNPREHQLYHHYANLKTVLFKHVQGTFNLFHMGSSAAIESRLLLTCVLAAAACHLGTKRGGNQQIEVFSTRARALSTLRQHVLNLRDDSDHEELILGIGFFVFIDSLSRQEGENGSSPRDRIHAHAEAVRQTITKQRSLLSRPEKLFTVVAIFGVDLASCGEATANLTPISHHAIATPLFETRSPAIDLDSVPISVQELLGFYANLHKLIFSHGCTLRGHHISVAGIGDFTVSDESRVATIIRRVLKARSFLHKWTPTTLLIYFNATLWDLWADTFSLGSIKSYWESLCFQLLQEGFLHGGSMESLLFFVVMAGENGHVQCPTRTWLTMRLLRAWGRLSCTRQERFTNALVVFLDLILGGTLDEHDEASVLSPEEFAHEVLDELGLRPASL